MQNGSSGDRLVSLLKDTLTALVRSDEYPDMTARQISVLLNCQLASEPQTVRGLASKLSISKPAVTRALNTLQEDDMIRRDVDESDRRSILVTVIGRGQEFIGAMARMMSKAQRSQAAEGRLHAPDGRLVAFMHGTMDALVSTGNRDFTWRQLAVFLNCYLLPEAQTVRGLAAHLNISKPAVTRALDRLGELKLIVREEDHADRRSVLVGKTHVGNQFLDRLRAITAEAYAASGARPRADAKAARPDTRLAA